MENIIELQHVQKSFDGFQLKDLSLEVKKRVCDRVYRRERGREINND